MENNPVPSANASPENGPNGVRPKKRRRRRRRGPKLPGQDLNNGAPNTGAQVANGGTNVPVATFNGVPLNNDEATGPRRNPIRPQRPNRPRPPQSGIFPPRGPRPNNPNAPAEARVEGDNRPQPGVPGLGGPKRNKRKRDRKRGKGQKAGVKKISLDNLPKDDILYRKPNRALDEARRLEIRKKFQLENLTKYSKEQKAQSDFLTIFQKMEFLDYEVDNRVKTVVCPICEKPIEDYYNTLKYENGDELAHIECIAIELKKKNNLAEQESLVYLGNGSFGVFKTKPTGEVEKADVTWVDPNDREHREKEKERHLAIADLRHKSGLELSRKIQYENRKLSTKQQRIQIKN